MRTRLLIALCLACCVPMLGSCTDEAGGVDGPVLGTRLGALEGPTERFLDRRGAIDDQRMESRKKSAQKLRRAVLDGQSSSKKPEPWPENFDAADVLPPKLS